MKKTVNIFLNNKLYKIVVYIVLLWLTISPLNSLAGKITGESKVCAGQIYTYTIDPGIYTLLDSKWECSPSGEFISKEKKTCKIRWNGTGELKVTAKVNLIAGLFGGFWDKYVKTVNYKDIGTLSNFIIVENNKAFYCKGESIKLSVNKDDLNSDYSYTYKWLRYFNGNKEYTYSTSSPELNYTILKDDGKYEFEVYALETDGCLSENTDLSKNFIVKSDALKDIALNIVQEPTCYGYRNTIIELNNIPDYRNTNLYKYNYITPSSAAYDVSFTNSSGETFDRHTFNYENPHIINENNIQLTFSNGIIEKGLPKGIYDVQIENEYFCIAEYNKTIDEPDQFLITGVEELGQYTYDTRTYNVKTHDGTDQIKLSLDKGIGSPVTYYYEGDPNPIGTSNLQSEVTLSGIDGTPHTIYAVDGDECNSTPIDIDLVEPEPFTISSIEELEPDCHDNNDGIHDNGRYIITVNGGIGPYTLEYNSNLVDETTGSETIPEDRYIIEGTSNAKTFTVQVSDIAQTINQEINIPFPDELQLKIEDIITSECYGFNDGKFNVIPFGRKENEYLYSIAGGTNILTTYTGDTAYYTGLESNTTYDIDVTVIKTVGGGSDIECSEDVSYTFTGFADTLGFNIADTIPPTCYEGIDGQIILESFGGHQDGIYNNTHYTVESINGLYNPNFSVKNKGTNVLIDTIRSFVEYKVQIEDDQGCFTIDTIRVTRNQNPVQFQFLDSAEIQCNKYDNGWVKLEGIGGDNSSYGYDYYIYTEGESFKHTSQIATVDTSIVKYGNDITFYNLAPGNYNIYVADSNDCLNPDNECDISFYKKDIFVYEPPIIEVEYWNTGVSQKGESDAKLWFNADGGNYSFIYELESADTLVTSGSTDNSIQINDLSEGVYTLKIKDTCNCSNKTGLEWMYYEGIRIQSPNEYLSLEQGTVQNVSCYGGNDGKVEIFGHGGWEKTGYTFGMDSIDMNTTGIFENLTSGYHLFHVKDSANVTVYDSIFVPQPEMLQLIVKDINDVQCNSGSDGIVTLTATGGTSPYQFSVDNINWQTDSVFSGLEKGSYIFNVRDINDCETTVNAIVNQPEAYNVSYIVTETLCGESNGAIECNVSGGAKPYSFQWSDGSNIIGTDSVISNLYSGEYYVTITDNHFCDTSFVVIVSNIDGPEIEILSVDSASCKGVNNGAIHYEIIDGVAPYHVKLYSGADIIDEIEISTIGTFSFESLEAKNYKIVVNDVNNCFRSIDNIIVHEPGLLTLQLDYLYHPICFGDSNGSIAVTANGGNGDNNYLWSNGLTENIINDLASGNYSVTITDVKGCSVNGSFDLIDPDKLTVDIGEEEIICEGQIYPLSAEGYSTYNWNYNGENISSASEIEAWAEGEYIVEVTDEKGCYATDTFNLIISNDLLEAEFLMPSEALESDTVVVIDISWPQPENIYWTFSPGIKSINSEEFLEEFTFEGPGVYTVSLTSYKAMCADSITKEILVLADTSNNQKSFFNSSFINSYKVYPNPNQGIFSVEVELSDYSDILIDIYDLQQNNLILRQKARNQKFYNIEFGFTGLNQGLYLVTVYVGEEKKTKKILVL